MISDKFLRFVINEEDDDFAADGMDMDNDMMDDDTDDDSDDDSDDSDGVEMGGDE